MPLVSFHELMEDAERRDYAVGYFECWNMESILAVADAAEALRSPVIFGFSGIYLPHPHRLVQDHLALYSQLGLEACRQCVTPSCVIFNESPHLDWVFMAIELGFQMVMFTDETFDIKQQMEKVKIVAAKAHRAGVAVEAEMSALPGVGGELSDMPSEFHLTDPVVARDFVEKTNADALAVNVGQAHLHGRAEVRLDLERISQLRKSVSVPLVLHGASSIDRGDIAEATRRGIRKINVGSALKRAYFEAMRKSISDIGPHFNPYEVVGSGLPGDVLTDGRQAVRAVVEDLMHLFGSAGKA